MREAFALLLVAVVLAILWAFHTSDEPSPIVIKASAPCWFEQHPTRPIRRWA